MAAGRQTLETARWVGIPVDRLLARHTCLLVLTQLTPLEWDRRAKGQPHRLEDCLEFRARRLTDVMPSLRRRHGLPNGIRTASSSRRRSAEGAGPHPNSMLGRQASRPHRCPPGRRQDRYGSARPGRTARWGRSGPSRMNGVPRNDGSGRAPDPIRRPTLRAFWARPAFLRGSSGCGEPGLRRRGGPLRPGSLQPSVGMVRWLFHHQAESLGRTLERDHLCVFPNEGVHAPSPRFSGIVLGGEPCGNPRLGVIPRPRVTSFPASGPPRRPGGRARPDRDDGEGHGAGVDRARLRARTA